MPIQNPILPGFHPDPSICRDGDWYYIVNSSFEYFPGLPIHRSRNLRDWEFLGHVLTRESQLSLQGVRASGGLFAPTLRVHEGVFYVICTNVTHKGNFLVTTKDPAGPWSEPVWLSPQGIDPSLFFDEDGACYFTGTSSGWIVQCTLNPSTGEAGELRRMTSGSGGRYPEGPHLFRRGEWYYLLMSEGGTEHGHMATLARARTPWGPWEWAPHNPVLSHRSVSHPFQNIGHVDCCRARDERWWAACLGVRTHGYPETHHLGRETMLVPMRWREDGWPEFGEKGLVPLNLAEEVVGEAESKKDSIDTFTQETLAASWNFLRNPVPGSWSSGGQLGGLSLFGQKGSLDDLGGKAWVGRRQQHFDAVFSCLLDFSPGTEEEEAGLTVHMNERHHYELFVTRRGKGRLLVCRQRIDLLKVEMGHQAIEDGTIELAVRATKDHYHFEAKLNTEWKCLASGATRYLSTEVAGGFTGVFLAMYSSGGHRPCGTPARFLRAEYHGS